MWACSNTKSRPTSFDNGNCQCAAGGCVAQPADFEAEKALLSASDLKLRRCSASPTQAVALKVSADAMPTDTGTAAAVPRTQTADSRLLACLQLSPG
jgi:hypothetical protein